MTSCGFSAQSSTWTYVFPIPIRVNPASRQARTIFIRFALVLQRMSTASPVQCALSPERPLSLSHWTERYAQLRTKGIPAISLALSSLSIVCCFMSCKEQDGTHFANSASLKYLAVIITIQMFVRHRISFRSVPRPSLS